MTMGINNISKLQTSVKLPGKFGHVSVRLLVFEKRDCLLFFVTMILPCEYALRKKKDSIFYFLRLTN